MGIPNETGYAIRNETLDAIPVRAEISAGCRDFFDIVRKI